MRRGGRGRPKVSASCRSNFCCDEVSASLRPSASRALASACSIRSFFSPRCGSEISTLWPLLVASASASSAAVLDLVRDQDQARRRLVVVELRQERRQHFARPERAVGLGKIGAVAPVLPGAEEEHLDAGEAALLVHGKDVGLLDAARIDALVRLDRRQRRQTVAIDRGALEVERRRRLLPSRRRARP